MDFKIEEHHVDSLSLKQTEEKGVVLYFHSNLLYRMISSKLFEFTFEIIPVLINMKYNFFIEIRYDMPARNYIPEHV